MKKQKRIYQEAVRLYQLNDEINTGAAAWRPSHGDKAEVMSLQR